MPLPFALPLALSVTAPLLVAASPLPSGGMGAPAAASAEAFDAIARATLLANELPRSWRGVYRSFDDGNVAPVELQLDQVTAIGQMVDLRGRMRIGGVETGVQGNLNAKSDQLDLLTLADGLPAGLENGGEFQGLQQLSLSGWEAPRLTSMGGRLLLTPGPAPSLAAPVPPGAGTVRGLW
ncbi:MAG: hypothetical protein VKN13_05975 [Cyanobacteriota bacterium]|nr:hypothetical protein [Cyanobacteriota bacterium]